MYSETFQNRMTRFDRNVESAADLCAKSAQNYEKTSIQFSIGNNLLYAFIVVKIVL